MRVHFISIGGAVMHNMALALHHSGFTVTGSDDEIFEPALSRLKAFRLLPETYGWHPERITPDIDFILLGMHARGDNPELLKARELGLTIYSFPEYIYEHSKNKIRIVVGGSHGKTSTTAMIMHVLSQLGRSFDYLVGSQLAGFETMVQLSDAPVIVIEGDEYLTSALDPKPKFHWYKPHTAILTGIAWDHINVFPTFENYIEQFKIFINTIEPGGKLIYCTDDPVLKYISVKAACTTIPYAVPEHEIRDGKTYIIHNGRDYPLEIFGKHNLMNLNAAMLACQTLNISADVFLSSIASFSGAARRLEKIRETGSFRIFRDFAHSPSKLKATVQAVAEQFRGFHLTGVFELHTFSSLNAHFLKEYKDSMEGLDEAVVYFNRHVFELKKMEILDPDFVQNQFGNVRVITERSDLEAFLQAQPRERAVWLMMSSGNFDGLNLETI